MADLTENELLWAESLRGQLIKSDDRDLLLRLVNDYRRLRAALAGAKIEGAEDAWDRARGQSRTEWEIAKAAHLKELG